MGWVKGSRTQIGSFLESTCSFIEIFVFASSAISLSQPCLHAYVVRTAVDCAPGEYWVRARPPLDRLWGYCLKAPRGFYSPNPRTIGFSNLTPCPPGSTTEAPGAASRDLCIGELNFVWYLHCDIEGCGLSLCSGSYTFRITFDTALHTTRSVLCTAFVCQQ